MTDDPGRPAPAFSDGEAHVYGKTPGTGDWKRITRLAALVVLVVYVVLFFLWNRDHVEVNLVVTSVFIPLFWVLMFSFVLGALAMYLLTYLRRRAARKARKR